ncbi:MAG: 50S ribosomal protein L9 [Patescibacteria group bacterium]|nr:50S ribosomal protein L9 [Patescibacteria group bacterium]
MKVILLANVKGVGKKGDIKEVADGHAGNFLIPRGLAAAATSGAVRNVEEAKVVARKKKGRARAGAKSVARMLRKEPLVFEERISSAGKLYSAVSRKKIATEIDRLAGDIEIKVDLDRPIKEPGEHRVKIILNNNTTVDARCVVRPSGN